MSSSSSAFAIASVASAMLWKNFKSLLTSLGEDSWAQARQETLSDPGSEICAVLCVLFFHLKLARRARETAEDRGAEWSRNMVSSSKFFFCCVSASA